MKRRISSTVLFLAVLAGCAPKPAAPPADVPPAPAPAEAATAAPMAPAATATAAPTAQTPAPSAAPSVVVALTPGATDTPAPVAPAVLADESWPALSTEQKAFVTGQLLGTEVVFITVSDASATCAGVAAKQAPAKGARMAELRVLWKTGYYDFSNRMAQGKLATYQGTFWLKEDATQGGIQVRAAPMAQGGTGRIHVKAARPGSTQSMDAELEVTVCATLDFTKKGK